MSELKYCQGPECHKHQTQYRIKGPKGNKTYQTRRRSSFYYGDDNFCSMNCYNDWFKEFGNQAIDHFGRITQAKILTEENGWSKGQNYYTWQRENGEPEFYFFNMVTREERGITEQQFNDNNYTLNT